MSSSSQKEFILFFPQIVLLVEWMGPKYVATGEKEKKQVCTFHYNLCLSVEKNTGTNTGI